MYFQCSLTEKSHFSNLWGSYGFQDIFGFHVSIRCTIGQVLVSFRVFDSMIGYPNFLVIAIPL